MSWGSANLPEAVMNERGNREIKISLHNMYYPTFSAILNLDL
jgi:hypothetical protein